VKFSPIPKSLILLAVMGTFLSINIFSEVNLSRLKYSPINPIGKKLLE
jgi:hypothetical protein